MALSQEPQMVDDMVWYYEKKTGLLVVHKIRGEDSRYIRTEQFTIPWRMIDKSLARRPRKRSVA